MKFSTRENCVIYLYRVFYELLFVESFCNLQEHPIVVVVRRGKPFVEAEMNVKCSFRSAARIRAIKPYVTALTAQTPPRTTYPYFWSEGHPSEYSIQSTNTLGAVQHYTWCVFLLLVLEGANKRRLTRACYLWTTNFYTQVLFIRKFFKTDNFDVGPAWIIFLATNNSLLIRVD